jgi:hypothetical protein
VARSPPAPRISIGLDLNRPAAAAGERIPLICLTCGASKQKIEALHMDSGK